MKTKIKAKWIKALRSGKYKQTKRVLCRGNQHGRFHCCLGVLSELAVKEGVCSRREAFSGNATLNEKVKDWAGTTESNPLAGGRRCSELNDEDGLNFKQIAQKIHLTKAKDL